MGPNFDAFAWLHAALVCALACLGLMGLLLFYAYLGWSGGTGRVEKARSRWIGGGKAGYRSPWTMIEACECGGAMIEIEGRQSELALLQAENRLDRARRLILSPRRLEGTIAEHQAIFDGILAQDQSVRAYPRPFGINAAGILGYLSPITADELETRVRDLLAELQVPVQEKQRTHATAAG